MRAFWRKKLNQENGPLAATTHTKKNDRTERARGLGRKAGEEIGNGNQMTALRY